MDRVKKHIVYVYTCKTMIDIDTRYKVIVHYTHFLPSLRKVAKIYGVSKSFVSNWIKKRFPNLKRKRTMKSIRKDIENCIKQSLIANPFITLNELASTISNECKINRSRKTIGTYVKQMNWSNTCWIGPRLVELLLLPCLGNEFPQWSWIKYIK